VRVFIEELAKFIRTYINGEVEMSDAIEIKRAVLKSPESLDSAFEIYKTMDNVKKELLEKFRDDLVTGFKKKGLNISDWSVETGKKYTGFNVQFGEKEQNFNLRFEFDMRGFNNFFWGISKKRDEYKNPNAWGGINTFMTTNFYMGKSTPSWPWYTECPNQEFDAAMRDWSISSKPWLMIKDGKLASQIIELADRVHIAFKLNNGLHLLCETELNNTI
jgi:hypothetical protein